MILMLSCSVNPYREYNRSYRKQAKELVKPLRNLPTTITADSIGTPDFPVGTIHFNLRKPHYVILHHTAQNSCTKTIETFTSPAREVSAHYVICKDGTVHHMLNDYFRAWHAGVARWGSIADINSVSLGIELDNNGYDSFPAPQINALIVLLNKLKVTYNIPAHNFIGHADIAPTRKQDPNRFFPWKMLSEKGFGLWPKDTTALVLPQGFNALINLRLLGYDVKDSLAAMQAFRRHYTSLEHGGSLSTEEQKILFSLVNQLP